MLDLFLSRLLVIFFNLCFFSGVICLVKLLSLSLKFLLIFLLDIDSKFLKAFYFKLSLFSFSYLFFLFKPFFLFFLFSDPFLLSFEL